MKQRIGYRALGGFPAKKDKNGNRICVNCGKIITEKRQRKYCDSDCYRAFETKNYHTNLRRKLMSESHFTCQKCGTKAEYGNHNGNWGHELILDHIIPISLGGEEFDESNLQILCIPCNKIKTAKDMKDIADHRRLEKILSKNKQLVEV